MRFLVDAQLPVRLAAALSAMGHDAVHTSQLPMGNRTPDSALAKRADAEGRTVVTKDRDFRDSHLVYGTPERLLIVSTGNIDNGRLLGLFERHAAAIEAALSQSAYVELTVDGLHLHGGGGQDSE